MKFTQAKYHRIPRRSSTTIPLQEFPGYGLRWSYYTKLCMKITRENTIIQISYFSQRNNLLICYVVNLIKIVFYFILCLNMCFFHILQSFKNIPRYNIRITPINIKILLVLTIMSSVFTKLTITYQ